MPDAEVIAAGANGAVQPTIGETGTPVRVPEITGLLTVPSPVCALPAVLDRGRAPWGLQRNVHDRSPMPMRIACGSAGRGVAWGRILAEGTSGEAPAGVIDRVGAKGDLIRGECEVDETPVEDETEE